VSPGSIYRHAGLEGWTKKHHADDVARAHVAARRAEADERRATGATALSPRRADGVAGDDESTAPTKSVPTWPGEPGARPWPKPPPEGYPDDGGYFIDWRPTREAVERETESMFRMIAVTALAMLQKPKEVYPVFMRQVWRFRRDFLGETSEEAVIKAEEITEHVLKGLEDAAFLRVDVVDPDTGIRKRLRTWPPTDPPFPHPGWKRKRTTPPPMPVFRGKRVST